jgi:hypothetical protein
MASDTARPYVDFYQEKNAILVDLTDIPGVNSQVAVRRWDCSIREEQAQRIIAEMDVYSSSANKTPQRWIQDPNAGTLGAQDASGRLPGKWRVVSHQYNPPNRRERGLYQVLAQGFLQAPALLSPDEMQDPAMANKQLADWSAIDKEARITKVVDWSVAGKDAFAPYYIVTYPNVAQETVAEFVKLLIPRGPITDPVFDSQTRLDGNYTFTAAKNIEQDDGSSIVVAILVKAGSPGLNIPIANNCGNIISRTLYMNAPVPVAVPSGESGIEYSVRDFSFDPELGMFTMSIERVEQKVLTTGVVTQASDLAETVESQKFSGVRIGDVDEANVAVPLWTPGNPAVGQTIEQQVTKNQNCTKDYGQVRKTVKSWLAAIVSKAKDLYEISVTTVNRGQAAAAADPSEPSGGVYSDVRNEQKPDGSYDITVAVKTERAVSDALLANAETVFDTTGVAIARGQSPSTPLTASVAAGTIVEKKGEKSKGALLDVTTTTRIEKNVPNAVLSATQTLFETQAGVVDKGQSVGAITAPAASGGVVVSKTGTLTPGGLQNVETNTKTELPVSSAMVENAATIFDTQAKVMNKAQSLVTSLTPVTPSGGVTEVKRGIKTPGGLLDVETDTRTENAVTGAVLDNSATIFATHAKQVDKSQATSTSLTPSVSAGVITAKQGQKTPGGLLDVVTDVTTELPVTGAVVENASTIFETLAKQVNKAQSEGTSLTPATPTGGVTETKRGIKTPGGLLDVETNTTTEQGVAAAVVTKQKTAFEDVTTTVNRNQASDAAAPSVAGQTVTNQKTPGGLVTQEIKTIVPVAASDAEHRSSATIFEIVAETTDRNQAVAATPITTIPSAGALHTVVASETTEGKYNNTARDVTEQGVANAVISDTKTLFMDDAVVVDKNQAANTSLTVPAAAGGVFKTITGRKTPGGLLDVETQTKTEAAVTGAVISNQTTALETVAVTLDKSQAAGTSLTSSLSGSPPVLVEKKGIKTQGALLDVETTTTTAVPSSDTQTITSQNGVLTRIMFHNKTSAEVASLIAGLPAGDSNTIHDFGINKFGLYSGMLHSRTVLTAGDGQLWARTGLTFVTTETHTDSHGVRWLYKDTYIYNECRGVGCSAGSKRASGGHQSGTLSLDLKNDLYFVKRVVQIDREVFTVGRISAGGVWTPAAPSSVGTYNIFTAAVMPWGT